MRSWRAMATSCGSATSRTVRLRHQRQLTAAGHDCAVVAPSLIPRSPAGGSRPTAGCDRPCQAAPRGELTPVWWRIRPMRRSAISSVRVRRRCARCARPASNVRFPAAPRSPLPPAAWTQVQSALARRPQVRPAVHYRAGRLHRGRRGGDGARDRLEAHIEAVLPECVPRTGGTCTASPARRGSGGRGRAGGRAWRHHALHQSPPAMAYLGLVPSEHSSGRTRRQAGSPRPATERRDAC